MSEIAVAVAFLATVAGAVAGDVPLWVLTAATLVMLVSAFAAAKAHPKDLDPPRATRSGGTLVNAAAVVAMMLGASLLGAPTWTLPGVAFLATVLAGRLEKRVSRPRSRFETRELRRRDYWQPPD